MGRHLRPLPGKQDALSTGVYTAGFAPEWGWCHWINVCGAARTQSFVYVILKAPLKKTGASLCVCVLNYSQMVRMEIQGLYSTFTSLCIKKKVLPGLLVLNLRYRRESAALLEHCSVRALILRLPTTCSLTHSLTHTYKHTHTHTHTHTPPSLLLLPLCNQHTVHTRSPQTECERLTSQDDRRSQDCIGCSAGREESVCLCVSVCGSGSVCMCVCVCVCLCLSVWADSRCNGAPCVTVLTATAILSTAETFSACRWCEQSGEKFLTARLSVS